MLVLMQRQLVPMQKQQMLMQQMLMQQMLMAMHIKFFVCFSFSQGRDTLELEINGERHEVAVGTTLAQLLEELNFATNGTAVAVDDSIVPKGSWADFKLAQGMKVDVFSLVAGG